RARPVRLYCPPFFALPSHERIHGTRNRRHPSACPDHLPGLRTPRPGELAEYRSRLPLEMLQLRQGIRPRAEVRPLTDPVTGGPSVPVLRVSEIFLSLQGEGPSAGTPAHFLRLQGCDVGCTWCDSKYTWDAAGGTERASDTLCDEAQARGRAALVVITGGEPLEHAGIGELIDAA